VRLLSLGIVVLACVVLFGPALLTQSPSQIASAPTAPSVPSAAATSSAVPTAMAPVTNVTDALTLAKTSGRAIPVTLTFSERDLTATAAAYFPQVVSGATLTDPVVHLRSGQLVLDMAAQVVIFRTSAEAVATVSVRNGRLATTVTTATIGGAALSRSTSDQVASQLDDAMSAGLPAKFVVTSITIGTGAMTVVGIANP